MATIHINGEDWCYTKGLSAGKVESITVDGKEWGPRYDGPPAVMEMRRDSGGGACAHITMPGNVRMVVNGVEWCPNYDKYDTPTPGADWDAVGVIAGGQALDGCTYPSDMMLVVARALLELAHRTTILERTEGNVADGVARCAEDIIDLAGDGGRLEMLEARVAMLEDKLDHITVTDE